ncbi:MAG: L,D-transpeptidase family protein [Longimicrobiales bacterium]
MNMKRAFALYACLCVAPVACKGNDDAPEDKGPVASKTDYPDARTLIRLAVAKAKKDTTALYTLTNGDTIKLSEGTVSYYRSLLRRGKPVWSSGEKMLARGPQMLEALGNATVDGLSPARYNYDAAQLILRAIEDGAEDSLKARYLADFDLVVTEGFNRYAADLTRGSIDPDKAGLKWTIPRAHPWEENLLRMAIRGTSPADIVERLRPQTPYYKRMMAALARHRDIQSKGGWPAVSKGKLVTGDSSATAAQLRTRLLASDDKREASLAAAGSSRPMVFDEDLRQALRHYQERHALEPDGALGESTLRELNEPIDSRLDEVTLNLDRWRWLPHDLGKFFVLVNVAGFELEVVENNVAIERMNVVVGQPGWKTPIFVDTMEHIVVNPSWNVPESIMREEIRPAMALNPNYLAEHNMQLTSDGTAKQLPGPDNALGDYKFIFPNKDNIYLHDTPAQSLFSRTSRAFSHGCIRLERPDDLAFLLASKATRASPSDIRDKRASGKESWVKVTRTLPVYILYFTVWVDEDGTTHVYHDVYGHDKAIAPEAAKVAGV